MVTQFFGHDEIRGVIQCILTGESSGTRDQAVEVNPSYSGLYDRLDQLIAVLPAGQYFQLDPDLDQDEYAVFQSQYGSVQYEFANSINTRDPIIALTEVVHGSMSGDYSISGLFSTKHGLGLAIALGGSPMNSAIDFFIVPAAAWPTADQIAPIIAAYENEIGGMRKDVGID